MRKAEKEMINWAKLKIAVKESSENRWWWWGWWFLQLPWNHRQHCRWWILSSQPIHLPPALLRLCWNCWFKIKLHNVQNLTLAPSSSHSAQWCLAKLQTLGSQGRFDLASFRSPLRCGWSLKSSNHFTHYICHPLSLTILNFPMTNLVITMMMAMISNKIPPSQREAFM